MQSCSAGHMELGPRKRHASSTLEFHAGEQRIVRPDCPVCCESTDNVEPAATPLTASLTERWGHGTTDRVAYCVLRGVPCATV